MTEDRVKNSIAYVFMNYQLKKLMEQGLLTQEELEKIDKMNCEVLNTEYKFSCNVM